MSHWRVLVLAVIGVAALAFSSSVSAQATTVDYDTLMQQQDKAAIRRQFAQLSPENKALIVRTQIERWINANRARLLPAQLQVMQEMAAVVSPDLYSPNRTEATLARVQELEKRAISLLGKEDVGRAATLEMAVYIPKAQ
jgi:hypothetical protein